MTNGHDDRTNREKILDALLYGDKTSTEISKIVGITRQCVNNHLLILEGNKTIHRSARLNLQSGGGTQYLWSLGTSAKQAAKVAKRAESKTLQTKVIRRTATMAEVPKSTNWLGGYVDHGQVLPPLQRDPRRESVQS